jgi:hypothetical protein
VRSKAPSTNIQAPKNQTSCSGVRAVSKAADCQPDKICKTSANIRLAASDSLHDNGHMSLYGQALEGSASRLATARYAGGSASGNGSENLIHIARQFRLAMIFKIPVGYQDEKGFHRGAPRIQKPVSEIGPKEVEKYTYRF